MNHTVHKNISFPLTSLLIVIVLISSTTCFSQGSTETEVFRTEKLLPATAVKNQDKTSTCWCFAGISLLESELLRQGKGSYDLSEMFIVRYTYQEKAKKYVRMHGHNNFAGGGELNDVVETINKFGIVPEEVYPGLPEGEEQHKHKEMDIALKAYVDDVIGNENESLSPAWFEGFCHLLDSFLGEVPLSFEHKGHIYTPESFAASLDLRLSDYILIASFSHHPFYEPFILEEPDNWSWREVFNVRLEELTGIIDHCLANGYTVGWSADDSGKEFSRITAIATVPRRGDKEYCVLNEEGTLSISGPLKEKLITQELRQEAFDNYSTTDDHAMHIIGSASDPYGQKFYIVKNSWGTNYGPHKGYFYVSEAYMAYKTLAIMVLPEAIPVVINIKLKR